MAPIRRAAGVAIALLATTGLGAAPAAADLTVRPGFAAEPYVTGQGFDQSGERGGRGIPAAGSLGFDATGLLYVARQGARFRSGEVEDLSALWRFPVGGARLSPQTEPRFLLGPPLSNPYVGTVRGRGEVWITTYDRDRKLGALYRMVDGRPILFAGGTPPSGQPPLLRQPEGVAVDAAGDVYVADREQNAVVRLDPSGRVKNPQHLVVTRPRMLAFDGEGRLWIGGDGTAQSPIVDGAGEIWRASPDGELTRLLQGPLPAGIAPGPAGGLIVAQRRTGILFALAADGRKLDFATPHEGTFVRGVAFAPDTPETRRAGIAGDLFVIVVRRMAWPVNEVIRVSGPFAEYLR
jgi:sugar lactone lactonase YvrE